MGARKTNVARSGLRRRRCALRNHSAIRRHSYAMRKTKMSQRLSTCASSPKIPFLSKSPSDIMHILSGRRDVAQFGSAPALGAGCRRFESCHPDHFDECGCGSMVELQPSKLITRVRFPSPAPLKLMASRKAGLFCLSKERSHVIHENRRSGNQQHP